MAETVEYQSANTTPHQDAFCERYESEHENNQARVERFNSDGSAIVHLLGTENPLRVVTLSKTGEVQEESEQ